jgi:hypothetical protein
LPASNALTAAERDDVISPVLGIANPGAIFGESDHLKVRVEVVACPYDVTGSDMCSAMSEKVGRRAPC